MKPHLDYGDIIYDQAYNTSFHQDIKSIQYSTSLSITGALRGTSREKLDQELGFKSLRQRRWYRKLCCLFKIINKESPSYLFQLVPSPSKIFCTKLGKYSPTSLKKYGSFENSFSSLTIKEWSNLDPYIRKSKSISIFKSNLLKFIRPRPNNVYYCHNPKGIRLLKRLHLGLSHLREHKFKRSFQDCLNPLCFCGNKIETYLPTSLSYLYKRKNDPSKQNKKY